MCLDIITQGTPMVMLEVHQKVRLARGVHSHYATFELLCAISSAVLRIGRGLCEILNACIAANPSILQCAQSIHKQEFYHLKHPVCFCLR